MIKIIILSLLLFYVFRILSRFFSFSAHVKQEQIRYKTEGPGQGFRKEKDISEKGRILED
ncbi:hypothetical protein LPTSP3_g30680 [Leptospira kobayashii]|uniref:DUF4834 domain-containing protein n=1 Tax=Leptospira kobayashii TaxID=1917830 RepID=A0ABN6KG47_9LEPT|nr:hypothetical protein [Leptospira kobayashii]BDA80138.1 hypothetical protein LPTSP3_g30680 [Leptospira kobayashii]